jgi:isopenicillin-N epimerase
MSSPGDLKALFLLDPDIVFLNHGSYGACPRPVFDEYQRWQRELERQPVEFLGRQSRPLLAEARRALAEYLRVAADEVVYFPNPSTAINMVARSLELGPGDEILTTDHEYGAMDRTWTLLCEKAGARYVRHPMPLPMTGHEAFADRLWGAVTPRTRVVFLSHITSPTALAFPAAEICRRARVAGILSIVDGAHAPGQLELDLTALGADVYTGACHKWLCAPKGSAFLYARREVQSRLEPLVVSWGWGNKTIPPRPGMGDTPFISSHEWQGTRDLAAFLATPAAIRFQAEHDWPAVRRACRILAAETRKRIEALTGLESLCPDSPDWFTQLVAARLPADLDTDRVKARLWEEFQVEVPLMQWNGLKLIRVSFQGYNSEADADALLKALGHCL